MAKTPEAVRGLLERVWKPARARALADRDALQALVAEEGGNFALAPWDWRYYAEKLRQVRANFDDAAIKPYLALDHMIEAAFDCATRLFGVSFTERKDIPVWHPDVRVWEVKDRAGQAQGAVLRRLLRPALEALRRLDDLAARPAEARRRGRAADPQCLQLLQGRRRRAVAAVAGRRPDAVPRIRPRPARHAVGRDLSLAVGHQRVHRFRRTALAALRALAGAAAGAAAVRAALPDRRAAAGRSAEALPRRAQIQPGLCHRGVRLLGADRSRIPHPAGLGQPRRAGVRARGTGENRHARGNLDAAPADRNSATSSPAITMRRAITATCGRR